MLNLYKKIVIITYNPLRIYIKKIVIITYKPLIIYIKNYV